MPEYYANDNLRWALGFDNPNKAGALLAALLPFAWWLSVNRFKNPIARFTCRIVGFAGVVTGVYILLHTYSRGAIVAVAAAAIYVAWRCRANWRKWLLPSASAAALFCASAALVVLPNRNADVTTDSSVTNRFELWKGALSIFSSAPGGVGAGNSGLIYMDWFQPAGRTERYRTMVNSYLTFLVEFGWLFSMLILFCIACFWLATSTHRSNLTSAARASLVATLVAGFLSTTLEDWRVAIPAFLAAAVLFGAHRRSLLTAWKSQCVVGIAFSGALLMACFLSGKLIETDPSIRFLSASEILVTPTGAAGSEVDILPDSSVLGADWPKRVRELASSLRRSIRVNGTSGSVVIVAGEQARVTKVRAGRRVVLVAPAKVEEETMEQLVNGPLPLLLLNPSFDEDGRVRFWKNAAAVHPERIEVLKLNGVGIDVAWAWEEVIDTVRKAAERPSAR